MAGRAVGAVGAAAAVLVAGAALAGCGGSSATASNDSVAPAAPSSSAAASATTTASAPPAAATTPAAQPPSPGAPVETGPNGPADFPTVAPSTVPPPGAPGVPTAVASEPEARFSATLQQNGIALSPGADTEVNLARVVCQEVQRGGNRASLYQSLLAIGAFQQAAGMTTLSPEQVAQLYVTTAENPANCN